MLDSDILEKPKEMDPEAVYVLPVDSEEHPYRESKLWLCARCQAPAFYNPYTDSVWGCKQYGTTSQNLIVDFVSRRSLVKQSQEAETMSPGDDYII